jgi:hypothetical protein
VITDVAYCWGAAKMVVMKSTREERREKICMVIRETMVKFVETECAYENLKMVRYGSIVIQL